MNLRRLFMSLALLLMFGATAMAQKVVSGVITDSASNAPLQSATVKVKGTKSGTQTATDGRFSITVPANASVLVITSVGYGSKEVAISSTNLDITLGQLSTALNDVVVIGYGTTRKKDLTGSIATVGEKDFQKGVITTPEQLIAGKVPGVSIISNSGQPGAGSTIRIRGGSSLSASNDPLIVIDGVPLDNDGISGAGNPLSFINANDIETFTVLKDASAAAIYGTRASNGVIIITTKKGKGGALKVDFSTVNSLSKVTDEVSVLNAAQFRDVVNQYGTASQQAVLGKENTNWQNLIYQTAFATNNNISVSGGIKGLPYRISLGYLNQDGVLRTDNLEKTSLAFVLNPVLFDNHLKIDLNLKASAENTRFANQGAIGSAIAFDPTQPVYSGDKRFNGYYVGLDASGNPVSNPVALLNDYHDNSKTQRSIGNIQFDYKFHFLPDLHANLNLGYDVSKGTGTRYASDSAASYYTRHGINDQYKQTKTNTLLEFYLNYTKDIASIKSHIDVLAGYSYNNYFTKVYNYSDLNARGDTITKPQYPFDEPEHTLISYFGRFNYFYNDRYLLTATLRRDGSSRFAPSNRWGLFPSVALAWSINNEAFLKNSNVVSNLKLRLGYGETGQQDGIGNYDYLSYYSQSASTASFQFGDTYYQGFRPGGFYANRKWEQTATTNVGIDYGFAHNRISGSIDYYLKKTSDLLNNIPQPAGTNFSAYIVANVGNMKNEGVEFNLNLQPIKTNVTTWDVNFNYTYNKNTITNLTVVPDDKTYIGFPSANINGSQGFAFINSVGDSKNTFYLYHQVYDEKTGLPIEGLFEDVNRDGIINEDDKYKGKHADPNMFLGFSTNVTYKNWSAGFVLRASFNNYVYNNIYSNNGRLNQVIGGPVLYNVSGNYLTTQFKGTTDQQLLSDYYIENASFLKMDNFNVGYDVGKILRNKAGLRLNATVQNVFVITKYSGIDPEISTGVDNNFYPRPRIYALGLNLNF